MPPDDGAARAECCGGPADGLVLDVAGATRTILTAPTPAGRWAWDAEAGPVDRGGRGPWQVSATRTRELLPDEAAAMLHTLGLQRAARYDRAPGLTARDALRFDHTGELRVA